MKVSYKWLQEYFDEELPSISELEELFMMHAFEVDGTEQLGNGDIIIDLDILPNRAHDALGHRGVAKELSTLLGKPMKKDELLRSRTPKLTTKLKIDIQDTEWCPRYTGAYIKGVKVGESPAWLKSKLESLGQKSINNVVDITNYVMFGLGQPTHIYDADKLTVEDGQVKIGVRKAKDGEKITLLGSKEYELDESIGVITDAVNDTPIAIAGIKGGAYAEVGENTVNIIVESAKFHPIKTRRASAGLKLRTDAVQRFENEVAIQQPIFGMLEVVRLITELAGGEVLGYADTNAGPFETHSVEVELSQLNAFLGSNITIKEAKDILDRFGWEYTTEHESIVATPPPERLDVRIKEDLYEEIGRVYGFNNIAGGSLPDPVPEKFINKPRAYSEIMRGELGKLGFTEMSTYTLVGSGEVELLSSLASDKNHVRKNLSGELTKALQLAEKNAPLMGKYNFIKIFEIGNVFTSEREYLSCAFFVRALSGKESKKDVAQIAELKKAQQTLEDTLGTKLQGVSSTANMVEFNLTDTIEHLDTPQQYPQLPLIAEDITHTPAFSYPFVLRDIAVWVPIKTSPDSVSEVIIRKGSELLIRADLFDEFSKDNKISYAFHLVFQSQDKTLTDSEVNTIMQKIESEIQSKGWEVR